MFGTIFTLLIFMFLIPIVFQSLLEERKQHLIRKEKGTFWVEVPSSYQRIGLIVAMFGGVLILVFGTCYRFQAGGATMGHLLFAAFFTLIGEIFYLIMKIYKVKVGKKVEVHSFLRPRREFEYQEIQKLVIGTKQEMQVFARNRKMTTIDRECCGYEEFYERARRCNIPIEER